MDFPGTRYSRAGSEELDRDGSGNYIGAVGTIRTTYGLSIVGLGFPSRAYSQSRLISSKGLGEEAIMGLIKDYLSLPTGA